MQIAFTATLSDRPVDPNAPVAPAATAPQLGVEGFTYAQLRDPQHLARLTAAFEAFAQKHLAPEAWSLFTQYRDGKGEGMAPEEVSSAILAAAPALPWVAGYARSAMHRGSASGFCPGSPPRGAFV